MFQSQLDFNHFNPLVTQFTITEQREKDKSLKTCQNTEATCIGHATQPITYATKKKEIVFCANETFYAPRNETRLFQNGGQLNTTAPPKLFEPAALLVQLTVMLTCLQAAAALIHIKNIKKQFPPDDFSSLGTRKPPKIIASFL